MSSSDPSQGPSGSSTRKKTVHFSGSSIDTKTGLSMSPTTAKRLYDSGAFVVMLDVPKGTEFGIDFPSWNVGERFLGVKMIPPGVHFVHWNAVNTVHSQVGPRSGFFQDFAAGECVVKRYVPADECVVDVSAEEASRVKSNLKNMDSGLAPYPYDEWKRWIALTNRISSATIARLQPTCGQISSFTELLPDEKFQSRRDKNPASDGSSSIADGDNADGDQMEVAAAAASGSKRGADGEKRDDDKLPKMSAKPGTSIRYAEVPSERFPAGSTPAEITRHSMDSSFQVERYLDSFRKIYEDHVSSSMSDVKQTDEILAELQFSFVCFLVGQHYDSFEQWKRLLRLFCQCHDAVAKHTELYLALISDMHFQIREVPDDFFVDIVSSNNFLVSLLTEFFGSVRANDAVDARLKDRAGKFEANLAKKFNWDFEQELDEGEDAPVVVDLDLGGDAGGAILITDS